MLNILTSNEITNVLVVVTRYFGGILLGTGGLVRAYSDATNLAIENTKIIKKDYGLEVCFYTDYSNFEKMKYYLKVQNIKIINTEFNEKIEIFVEITDEKLNNILEKKDELNFNFDSYKICCKKFIEYVENC